MKRIERAYWAIGCWLVLALIGYGLQPLVSSSGSDQVRIRLLEQALQRTQLTSDSQDALIERQDLIDRYLSSDFVGTLYQLVPARLTPLFDPNPRRSSARIDRGSEVEISPGMGVIGASGVIGKVVRSEEGWSTIQLADDPAFVIPFLDEDGGAGIFAGGPPQGQGHPRLRMEYIELTVGEVIRTHGGGAVFPEGLVIGVVAQVKIPHRESQILLSQGLKQVQEVLVLVPLTRGGSQ